MITDISKERQTKILENALDWLSEHFDFEELYEILTDKLTMTDDEIDFYGFELSDFKAKKGISLIHLHEENDDCDLYLSKPYNMFKAAIVYQQNLKNNINHLTLDRFASEFDNARIIDKMAYTFMCRHISPNGEIASVYEFDFEKGTLSVCNRESCKFSGFYFCDIGEAIDEATFNDALSIEDKHSIFIQQLIGKEIDESIESDDEESPSMSM